MSFGSTSFISKTKEEFAIERFSVHDLDAIVENERFSAPNPWSKQAFYTSLEDGHICLGVKSGACWVAHAVFSSVLDELELLILSVAQAHKRKGIATSFLSEVFAQARQLCFNQVHLEVRVSNTSAIALYKNLGFQQQNLRRNYYPVYLSTGELDKTAKEDALLFTLSL